MSSQADGRHLTTAAFLAHWDNGAPVVIPVAGDPPLQLRMDPSRARVTLRAPVPTNTRLPTNPLAHVRLELGVQDDQRVLDISTTDERLVVDGYSMLTAVADRIQLQGASAVEALEATLATWRSILATRVRMSAQAEVGLVGELLVLEALAANDAGPSLSCWRGGHSEEHDFGFEDADLEVKTTSGERRQHWVHGLGQLVPTGKTPLWLLSVQITRAGAGDGRTLAQLVDDVLAAADTDEQESVHRGLAGAGWRAGEADLFAESWRLRSAPAAFRIDDLFPRLTARHLTSAGVDVSGIRQVAYEVDLTGRPPSPGTPHSLNEVLTEMEAARDDD